MNRSTFLRIALATPPLVAVAACSGQDDAASSAVQLTFAGYSGTLGDGITQGWLEPYRAQTGVSTPSSIRGWTSRSSSRWCRAGTSSGTSPRPGSTST